MRKIYGQRRSDLLRNQPTDCPHCPLSARACASLGFAARGPGVGTGKARAWSSNKESFRFFIGGGACLTRGVAPTHVKKGNRCSPRSYSVDIEKASGSLAGRLTVGDGKRAVLPWIRRVVCKAFW